MWPFQLEKGSLCETCSMLIELNVHTLLLSFQKIHLGKLHELSQILDYFAAKSV